MKRSFCDRELDQIAFPMGGLGAGMICMQGTGALGNVSIQNEPNVHFEPNLFAALHICGDTPNGRVLEAPVPGFKVFSRPALSLAGAGNGLQGKNYGLPRFSGEAEFRSAFPFATLSISDETVPLGVSITGWSPFVPGDDGASGLPFAALEYRFENNTTQKIQAVFSFHAVNFLGADDSAFVEKRKDGFVLRQPPLPDAPWKGGAFYAFCEDTAAVDAAWFRGGFYDTLTMLWTGVEQGKCPDREFPAGERSDGGSLFVPFSVEPGESKTVRLKLCWYVPESRLRIGSEAGCCCCGKTEDLPHYKPWYSARFSSIEQLHDFIAEEYSELFRKSALFRDTFAASTLPDSVLDAIEANLSILKAPTILRQTDGRLWGWEGCCDTEGCCHGTCTHVWNYAQAICHLFPALERSLRETEFYECQNEEGHQQFRAPLPIRPSAHDFYAAADGQLGGIMKVYRDWHICGDDSWLCGIWPKVKQSLHYCIETWDPDRQGVVREPHHNTYDIEFWGPDPMCTSFYLGALKAAAMMAETMGEDAAEYRELFQKGRDFMENTLFNGEYFEQIVQYKGLRAELKPENPYPETQALLEAEGPKYQYGSGCLSDGVLGAWMAEVCGVGEILDPAKVRSHLQSVFRYNFRETLQNHANPQRPGYALGKEGGLLLCSWPHGGKPSLPFIYSDEVWTGIEYQAASHMILMGEEKAGRKIVETCRARYDGTVRNPYDEYECGHWYARAMASYALIQAYTGLRLDERTHTLYLKDRSEDYSALLAGEHGWGLAGMRGGKPFAEAVCGILEIDRFETE